MKNTLIAFFVAFALSIVFTFLPLIPRASLSELFNYSLGMDTLVSIVFGVVNLAVFFAVFYFLGNSSKMLADKPTVIALLLGVTLGPAVLFLLNIFLYSTYFGLYLTMAAGSAVSGIFQFFLPALIALLYVELKEKKTQSNLIAP